MDRQQTNDDLAVPAPAASPTTSSDSAGRASLSAWLTAGRLARGLTREHVARVTRIQLRTLERLEEGRFDELPADVFVRGFIRNYARCVGLSVDEALMRYGACGFAAAPVASPMIVAQARALLETMAPLHAPTRSTVKTESVVLVPHSSPSRDGLKCLGETGARAPQGTEPVLLKNVAPIPEAPAPAAVAAAPAPATKPRRVRDSKGRFLRKSEISAQIEAVSVDAIADEELEVEITVDDFVAAANELLAAEVPPPPPPVVAPVVAPVVQAPKETAKPVVTVRTSAAPAIPTLVLVIDDEDPEAAEREREERAKREKEKDGGWRSFLPPALLDQDRGRQGGLTLAVIILLIVATLTLSYLMRRPSSTGEGVTQGAPQHGPSLPPATLVG